MIIVIIESVDLELYITKWNLSFPKFPHQVMNEAGKFKNAASSCPQLCEKFITNSSFDNPLSRKCHFPNVSLIIKYNSRWKLGSPTSDVLLS